MSEIRLLQNNDIPSIMRLVRAASWNQTEADWSRMMRLEPDGCFGLEADGGIVATATACCYGGELAWIGMVLTDPAHRGKGYARRLMEHALEWLEGRGVAWIKLDATDFGKPLYDKLGFEDEGYVERWGLISHAGSGASLGERFSLRLDIDRQAFGTDRSALLRDLSACECRTSGDAFAFGRPGANAAHFGPCVAKSADEARTLLQWFLGAHAGEPVYWDILPANEAALRLAREFGFERRRRLTRQARKGAGRPTQFARNDRYVFAIAGFEYG